nr:unnamed protein product [Digitaria exilis]
MAEIEVVSDGARRDEEEEERRRRGAAAGEPDPVVDVYSAAAYGDLERLRGFVECGGAAALMEPDGNGYHALQWAALNNYPHVALYLIEHGADVNATDHAGQTALHWAAVRGSTSVANVLMERGARVEAADVNGYRAVHVAAQYGQTSFLYHIISKYGADFDALDNDGRSALHWYMIIDNYSSFIMHVFLSNATKLSFEDKYFPGRSKKIGYAPFLFAYLVICLILFLNSIVFAPNFSRITATAGLWSWAAVSLFFASQVMFYRVSRKNPGYIKASTKRYDPKEPLMEIDLTNSSTWTGNWSQLCPTCKRNRWDFFVFLCMGIATSFLGAAVGFHRLWTEPIMLSSSESWTHFMVKNHPGAVLFMFLDVFLLTGALILTGAQAVQIAWNITTNEQANKSRYSYLRGPDGRFRNPYSRGCQRNCTDFCVNGYTNDEEVAWPTLPQTVQRS